MLLSGKDKGKVGKVTEVVRSKNWVFVEGLNTVSEVQMKGLEQERHMHTGTTSLRCRRSLAHHGRASARKANIQCAFLGLKSDLFQINSILAYR